MFVMCIPWGDISTAYTTTGIPDIETYTGASPKTYSLLKWQFLYNWLLRTSLVRNIAKKKIKQKPAGPTDEMRANAKGFVWGEVTNAQGEKKAVRLQCPEGYTLNRYQQFAHHQKSIGRQFQNRLPNAGRYVWS
jgi:short subunit dehydrogenase-like uncharacterized protein